MDESKKRLNVLEPAHLDHTGEVTSKFIMLMLLICGVIYSLTWTFEQVNELRETRARLRILEEHVKARDVPGTPR